MHLPKDEGTSFEPCPAGTHAARCVGFIDLGSHAQEYAGENKGPRRLILLSFEIPGERRDDGKPFVISKRYTWSVHEKANLRKDLESWRSKRFADTDFGPGGFDIRNVLDKPCTITVNHTEKEGRTYVNIAAIGAAMKGINMPPRETSLTYVALVSDLFDQAAFDGLSERMKEMIQKSPEWAAIRRGGGRQSYGEASGSRQRVEHQREAVDDDRFPGDIPFPESADDYGADSSMAA